jgi:hypothetical protein
MTASASPISATTRMIVGFLKVDPSQHNATFVDVARQRQLSAVSFTFVEIVELCVDSARTKC